MNTGFEKGTLLVGGPWDGNTLFLHAGHITPWVEVRGVTFRYAFGKYEEKKHENKDHG